MLARGLAFEPVEYKVCAKEYEDEDIGDFIFDLEVSLKKWPRVYISVVPFLPPNSSFHYCSTIQTDFQHQSAWASGKIFLIEMYWNVVIHILSLCLDSYRLRPCPALKETA